MKKIITLLAFTALVLSCGSLQNLSKKSEKQTKDSSAIKSIDSISVSKLSNTKESTSSSSWGSEIIVEYFPSGSGSNSSPGTIGEKAKIDSSLLKDGGPKSDSRIEPFLKNTGSIKRIIFRERNSTMLKTIIGSQNQDSTKLIKKEAAQLKASKTTTDQEKVVSHKAKWPYILLALLLLVLFIYLYFNKIKPPFL